MDTLIFYFEYLFKLCSIYPSYTLTLAAFSMLSFKLNCRDINDESKPSRLMLLDQVFFYNIIYLKHLYTCKLMSTNLIVSYFITYQETADIFRQGLLGGLNISSCQYTSFSGLDVDNLLSNNMSTQCIYTDCNR